MRRDPSAMPHTLKTKHQPAKSAVSKVGADDDAA
jgi:hypothetical protein